MVDITLLQQINADEDLIYIILRCVILFITSIFLIRVGCRRYYLNTPLDFLLVIVLGGLVSRGINGPATLVTTIGALITLILLHKIFSKLSFLSNKMEELLKGKSHLLIHKGKLKKANLARLNITETDLSEQLHQQLNITSFDEVEKAYLERNGSLSFILKKR